MTIEHTIEESKAIATPQRIRSLLSIREVEIISSKSILLVDDDEIFLTMLEAFLTDCGFKVDTYHNGIDAAWGFVLKQHDLVLTDINMPGITGITLADYIKNRNPETPVIAVSGNHVLPSRLFDKVLEKPFALVTMLQVIMSCLRADCD